MFQKARLKLTAWYLLIIMLISVSFSLVIYRVLTLEFVRFERIQRFRFERRFFTPPPFDPELINETKKRLGLILIFINAGILVFAGGVGYFLAGKTLRPIKEMVDEQNRFISDASHELRTPLTAIKTSMEVSLRDKNFTLIDARKIITDSLNEVNRLKTLSDNLLQLIQYQTTKDHIKFQTVAFDKLIKEIVEKFTPLAKQKNLQIKTQLIKCQINGDPYGLSSLLSILIDNAIKYSLPDKNIIISLKKADHTINLSVKDFGIGIAKKDLPYIFNRFYRADTARSKKIQGGYGLGLAIAKEIVDLHGGKINVLSSPNKGSLFSVIFQLN